MGNSLRCCLACVLPCGSLDLIHIVHLNGHVEEITHPITAAEILKANPNHVLTKTSSQGNMVRRILILSPESELKRGTVYFLIPDASLPEKKKKRRSSTSGTNKTTKQSKVTTSTTTSIDVSEEDCDRYLSRIMSQKKSIRRDRRHSHPVVWQPNLPIITED